MSTELTRMISFRLSAEEYDRCRQLCAKRGISSVSEFARTALDLLFQQPLNQGVESRLLAVESRLDKLSTDLESVYRTVSAYSMTSPEPQEVSLNF